MLSCSAYFLIRHLTRKAYKKDLCVRYNSTVSENQLNRESLLESGELDLNKEINQQTKTQSRLFINYCNPVKLKLKKNNVLSKYLLQ